MAATSTEPSCSIERALQVIGERWSFLILRDALLKDTTRFADFQDRLGITSSVLTDRLETLVSAGVFEKRPYREAGSRVRYSYHPTRMGASLKLVLGALQQWSDEFLPREEGPTRLRTSADDGLPVSVAFVDAHDHPLPMERVLINRVA